MPGQMFYFIGLICFLIFYFLKILFSYIFLKNILKIISTVLWNAIIIIFYLMIKKLLY
jgi:hypothetical protein